MTNLKLLSAALIATAMVATPALARENRAAVRQHTVTTNVDGAACVRAPDVGAFASDPWTAPPYGPEEQIRRPDFFIPALVSVRRL